MEGRRPSFAALPDRLDILEGGSVVQYKQCGLLGQGSTGRVYSYCSEGNGSLVAIKVVSKALPAWRDAERRMRCERELHAGLRHPGIVRLLGVVEDDANMYLVLERCTGATLEDAVRRLGPLTEQQAARVMEEVLPAVQHLHASGICHRNIQLSNLFLDDSGAIKLGDFGASARLGANSSSLQPHYSPCGTPTSMPVPNALLGHGVEAGSDGATQVPFGPELDVWALGCSLYAMLVGRPPFEASDAASMYQKFCNAQLTFPAELQLSNEAHDFMTSMMRCSPQERPPLQELAKHPFFEQFRLSDQDGGSSSSSSGPGSQSIREKGSWLRPALLRALVEAREAECRAAAEATASNPRDNSSPNVSRASSESDVTAADHTLVSPSGSCGTLFGGALFKGGPSSSLQGGSCPLSVSPVGWGGAVAVRSLGDDSLDPRAGRVLQKCSSEAGTGKPPSGMASPAHPHRVRDQGAQAASGSDNGYAPFSSYVAPVWQQQLQDEGELQQQCQQQAAEHIASLQGHQQKEAGSKCDRASQPTRLIVQPSPPAARMPTCRSPSVIRVAGANSPSPAKGSWPQLLPPLVPGHLQQLQSVEEEPAVAQMLQEGHASQQHMRNQREHQEGINAILALISTTPREPSSLGPAPFITAGVTAAGPGPPPVFASDAVADDSPCSASSIGSGLGRRVARDIWASVPLSSTSVRQGTGPFEAWSSSLAVAQLPSGSTGDRGAQADSLETAAASASGRSCLSAASPRPRPSVRPCSAISAGEGEAGLSAAERWHQQMLAGMGTPRYAQQHQDWAPPELLHNPETATVSRLRVPLSPLPPPVPPSPKLQLQQHRRTTHGRISASSIMSASPASSSPARQALLHLPPPALLPFQQPSAQQKNQQQRAHSCSQVPFSPTLDGGAAAPPWRASSAPCSALQAHGSGAQQDGSFGTVWLRSSDSGSGPSTATPSPQVQHQGHPRGDDEAGQEEQRHQVQQQQPRRESEPAGHSWPLRSPAPPCSPLQLPLASPARQGRLLGRLGPGSSWPKGRDDAWEGWGGPATGPASAMAEAWAPHHGRRASVGSAPNPQLGAPLPPPAYVLLGACRPEAAPQEGEAAEGSSSRAGSTTGAERASAELHVEGTWAGADPASNPSSSSADMLSPRSPAPPSHVLPHSRSPALRVRAQYMQPSQPGAPSAAGGGHAWQGPRVVRYLDHRARYGFGYLLSTDLVGVAFNDGSHMLRRADSAAATYLASSWRGADQAVASSDRDSDVGGDGCGGQGAAAKAELALLLPPGVALAPGLQKKRALLNRFFGCLALGQPWGSNDTEGRAPRVVQLDAATEGGAPPALALASGLAAERAGPGVFVWRVVRSPKGHVLMRFSDGSQQVAFGDGAQLLLGAGAAPVAVLLPPVQAQPASVTAANTLSATHSGGATVEDALLLRLMEARLLLHQAAGERQHGSNCWKGGSMGAVPGPATAENVESADCCSRDQRP